jgi:hypothetical protein
MKLNEYALLEKKQKNIAPLSKQGSKTSGMHLFF